MAGPYTGTWRQSATSLAEYTGALKWGTGINPVHSIPGEGPYLGGPTKLNIDPVAPGGGIGTDTMTDEGLGLAICPEDNPSNLYGYDITDAELWGYNEQTGTADRPSWGEDTPDNATREKTQNSTSDGYPPWGGSRKTGPAGRIIRAIRRGNDVMVAARVLPNEDVAQGWTNKTHGRIADSRTSDPSQYEMQTSMTQRYKVREGSQAARASEYSAPIESRVVGQKVKNYTSPDSSRHWDMQPYEQVDYMRPFLSRQAGTGYREWNYPNEMYVSPVIQREPSPDPELGPVAGSTDYGYSVEDGGVFY